MLGYRSRRIAVAVSSAHSVFSRGGVACGISPHIALEFAVQVDAATPQNDYDNYLTPE